MKTRIIGIAGKKQSGKDFIASAIGHHLQVPVVRVAFADALKVEVARAIGVHVNDIDKDKNLYRGILQWWGTDYRRKKFGEDFWIKKWKQAINLHTVLKPDCIIVTPDVRFKNEMECIKKAGGVVIRVTKYPVDDYSDLHVSETEMDKLPAEAYDFLIVNNFMKAQDTLQGVKTILEQLQ